MKEKGFSTRCIHASTLHDGQGGVENIEDLIADFRQALDGAPCA